MALKPMRDIVATEYAFTMDAAAAAGGIVSIKTAGSGIAENQDASTVVEYKASPSGAKPIGLLLDLVVDKDTTDVPLNNDKQEVVVGSKVSILRTGTVVTNMIIGTPAAGNAAFVNCSGYIGTTNVGNDVLAAAVGQFLSTKDENGYVKVYISIPGGNIS